MGSDSGRRGSSPGRGPHGTGGIEGSGLGLALLGYLCLFIPGPPTWQLLVEPCLAEFHGPRRVERTQVLCAQVGSASSQLGGSKPVTSALCAPVLEAGKQDH